MICKPHLILALAAILVPITYAQDSTDASRAQIRRDITYMRAVDAADPNLNVPSRKMPPSQRFERPHAAIRAL